MKRRPVSHCQHNPTAAERASVAHASAHADRVVEEKASRAVDPKCGQECMKAPDACCRGSRLSVEEEMVLLFEDEKVEGC